MDSWKRFDVSSLPNKKAFYSGLNMEDITDVDYKHAKRVFKIFNNKSTGEYVSMSVCEYMLRVINYYFHMFLRILEINLLKYMNLNLFIFYQHLD